MYLAELTSSTEVTPVRATSSKGPRRHHFAVGREVEQREIPLAPLDGIASVWHAGAHKSRIARFGGFRMLFPEGVMIDGRTGAVVPSTGRYAKRLSELSGIFSEPGQLIHLLEGYAK